MLEHGGTPAPKPDGSVPAVIDHGRAVIRTDELRAVTAEARSAQAQSPALLPAVISELAARRLYSRKPRKVAKLVRG